MVYFNGKKLSKKKAIKAINETMFFPKKGKDRLLSMIEGRPDWYVSRQRVWGVPLPIFIDKKTKEPLRDKKVIDRIAEIYEKEGSDCWFTDEKERFLEMIMTRKTIINLKISSSLV